MKLEVSLFARAKELAKTDRLSLELEEGTTVGAFRRRLALECPALAGLLERSAVAVNEEFAGDDTILNPDAKIALLPPVSGGQ